MSVSSSPLCGAEESKVSLVLLPTTGGYTQSRLLWLVAALSNRYVGGLIGSASALGYS